MRRATLILIATAALPFSLGTAAVAQAHPVSAQRAAQAIRSDRWDFGPTPPTVDACTVDRYGTLCTVTTAICYDDALGPAIYTDTERVWVSRTRRRVSVTALPGEEAEIWGAPNGCGAGDQPAG